MKSVFLLFAMTFLFSSAFAVSDRIVLKKADLKDAFIFSPFMTKRTAPFGWVCMKKSKSRFEAVCDDLGINEFEGPMEELQMTLSLSGQRHEYGLRHGINRSECRRIKMRIEKLISHSSSYCVRGSLVSWKTNESTTKAEWVFDEIKADTGTVCEFNGCD